MLRNLLICGLIAGLCGGLLATGFARVVGEGPVDQAIAFEGQQAKAAGEAEEAPLVSRTMQKSFGLLTAAVVYGLSLGGLFALAFAAIYGRVGKASPARTIGSKASSSSTRSSRSISRPSDGRRAPTRPPTRVYSRSSAISSR